MVLSADSKSTKRPVRHVHFNLPDYYNAMGTTSRSTSYSRRNPRKVDPVLQRRAKKIIASKLLEGYCLKGNKEKCRGCEMPLMVKNSAWDGVFGGMGWYNSSKTDICFICGPESNIMQVDNEDEDEDSSIASSEHSSILSYKDDGVFESKLFAGDSKEEDYDEEEEDIHPDNAVVSRRCERCFTCGMEMMQLTHGNECPFCDDDDDIATESGPATSANAKGTSPPKNFTADTTMAKRREEAKETSPHKKTTADTTMAKRREATSTDVYLNSNVLSCSALEKNEKVPRDWSEQVKPLNERKPPKGRDAKVTVKRMVAKLLLQNTAMSSQESTLEANREELDDCNEKDNAAPRDVTEEPRCTGLEPPSGDDSRDPPQSPSSEMEQLPSPASLELPSDSRDPPPSPPSDLASPPRITHAQPRKSIDYTMPLDCDIVIEGDDLIRQKLMQLESTYRGLASAEHVSSRTKAHSPNNGKETTHPLPKRDNSTIPSPKCKGLSSYALARHQYYKEILRAQKQDASGPTAKEACRSIVKEVRGWVQNNHVGYE
eukprot:g14008.t1 g14008   contig9:941780-943414(+)